MEVHGEFRPFRISWEQDRVGVHRIELGLRYIGDPPFETIPAPPRDIPCVRAVDAPEDGGAHGVLHYFYEGALESDLGRAIPQYEFNGSYNQEPITSHPKIVQLLREYKGRLKDGRVEWPAVLGSGTAAGFGRAATGKQNVMYGVESYLDFGAIWQETRIYRELPGDLWAGVGEIFENPPGNPPDPGKRNWLKLAPVGRQRGNVTEVANCFLLSGRNGWVGPIYDGSIV